ncbi:MAG TPA: formate/nitrite transporter family protein [Solirubrobacteraceae bacterium]|nr:formate/nitrite transporter family protein [Solirubrobacteraceae bacterium]
MSVAPEPREIFQRTREEGKRRLTRSRLELSSTALVAGFDVVFGIVALATVTHAAAGRFGEDFGHLLGSLAFGIAFVFIVVGRSELFTENFLVPVTALRQGDISPRKLAELWVLSPIFNLVGGIALVLVVSVPGVLPSGSGAALVPIAEGFDDNGALTAFLSAIAGGALITVMTWLVEGVGTIGGRIVCAWIGGAVLTLGMFNHVIVVTLEMVMGIRFGADVGGLDVVQNFWIAAAGNMVGGLLYVTLTRTGQALGASDADEKDLSV